MFIYNRIKAFISDSLFSSDLKRNSNYLIISQLISAATGFLFWLISAHLYSTKVVGLAASLISIGLLASTLTSLGLSNTVLRYLPTTKKPGGLISSSLIAISLACLFLCGISFFGVGAIILKHKVIHSYLLLVLILFLLTISNSLNTLVTSILLAYKKGNYILTTTVVATLPRLILLLIFTKSVEGITYAYISMLVIGVVVGAIFIFKKCLKLMLYKPDFKVLIKVKAFAFGNYFGGIFAVLPTTLLPVMTLSRLGAENAAYLYMPLQLSLLLSIIASSVSQALLSETSQKAQDTNHDGFLKEALGHIYKILVPTMLMIISLGWIILRLYGKAYESNGFIPLVIFSLSSIFIAVNWLGDTLLNIKKRSFLYFIMNVSNGILVVCLSYLFASKGLLGISLGWISGQFISALIYVYLYIRTSKIPAALSIKQESV